MKLKLKAGRTWLSYFLNWSSELRKIDFITRLDFSTREEWEPTYTADTGTYIPADAVTDFWERDGLIHISFFSSGTTSGTPVEIFFTLPIPAADECIDKICFACSVVDVGGLPIGGTALITTENRVKVTTYNRTAFTAGVGVLLSVSGFYRRNESF